MISRLTILSLLLTTACSGTIPEATVQEIETPSLVWPGAPEKARIQFVRQFSSPEDLGLRESFARRVRDALVGDDDRQMTRPYAVAANNNKVAVADPGAAMIHLFDTERKSYHPLTDAGDYSFASPIGVALTDERLYIADSELGKVFILNHRLKLLSTIDTLQRPTSLALDPNSQRLYVADTLAHNIQVFDQDGKALFSIGGRGEADQLFNYPSHLAIADDRLFVNDTMNFRIQIFSLEGRHLRTFGIHGVGSGHLTQPKGVAVDSAGHVYVADALSNRVQIFEQDGTFLLGFGRAGDNPGAFQMPAGLAIWDDLIYVADSFNQRVQVFQFLSEEN
jgi:DNA-binding beta-propeller fold protein YncE